MNLVELAQRIRSARMAKGLTLDQVSEASGLGKGLLSKVENFRVTPTLPTLAKLCETLGVKLSELVDGLDKKPKLCVVRRTQRKALERDSGDSNIIYHSLAHARANRAMDPFELVVPAHGGRKQPMPHEGEEFLVVLKGKVEFEFDGEVHSLAEGDSLYFDAETEHRLFNVTDKEARVLCVFLERGGRKGARPSQSIAGIGAGKLRPARRASPTLPPQTVTVLPRVSYDCATEG